MQRKAKGKKQAKKLVKQKKTRKKSEQTSKHTHTHAKKAIQLSKQTCTFIIFHRRGWDKICELKLGKQTIGNTKRDLLFGAPTQPGALMVVWSLRVVWGGLGF